MSAEALPVTMFAFGAAELSGVQPIRPPPPEPTDSGLPPDSPSTQDATPAAAAFEYPLSTRYWPIASRLLPLAMSDCTVELALDEDVVLVPPLEDEAVEVDDRSDVDDADPDDADPDDGHLDDPDEAESAVDGAHVDDAEVDDAEVDDAEVDDADVDGAGALEAWWRPLGIVTTWPA
jgi:hypothetical protein